MVIGLLLDQVHLRGGILEFWKDRKTSKGYLETTPLGMTAERE